MKSTPFTPVDLPETIGTPVPAVKLSDAFHALAARWGIPVETLASYVCEQYGNEHADAPGVILRVNTGAVVPTEQKFAFEWAD